MKKKDIKNTEKFFNEILVPIIDSDETNDHVDWNCTRIEYIIQKYLRKYKSIKSKRFIAALLVFFKWDYLYTMYPNTEIYTSVRLCAACQGCKMLYWKCNINAITHDKNLPDCPSAKFCDHVTHPNRTYKYKHINVDIAVTDLRDAAKESNTSLACIEDLFLEYVRKLSND